MENSSKEVKRDLRKQVLSVRSRLSREEVADKSRRIFKRLTELPRYHSSRWIMAYMDFNNEVLTREFIGTCLSSNRRVAVPRVVDEGEKGKCLWACEIRDLESDLEAGTYGILEPKKDRLRRIDPCLLDLIVVPGVVFDLRKNRIGYGAGYYDRLLHSVGSQCLKAGVAFELQLVENVPVEEHDIPMDILITESRML